MKVKTDGNRRERTQFSKYEGVPRQSVGPPPRSSKNERTKREGLVGPGMLEGDAANQPPRTFANLSSGRKEEMIKRGSDGMAKQGPRKKKRRRSGGSSENLC